MHHHMIIFFLLTFIGRLGAAADPNHISINCGGDVPATGQWLREPAPKGLSTTSTAKEDLTISVDPVPYKTARISRSQFSYSLQLSPGQKFIRLHFNPSSYNGFESFNDLFAVEAGHLSLLANFSASITARALAVNIVVKEFCIIVQENETLNLVFSPETSSYAFVNGIEIISVPSTTPYSCHGGDDVLAQKYVDNTTALERVHYQHIKWGSVSSDDDIGGMFGMWAEPTNANKVYNRSWSVSVDVGFKYLVRLHLCEVGLGMDFVLLINNMLSLTNADMLQQSQRGYRNLLWYNNYVVMVERLKQEDKRDISISLHSHHEFLDRHGPLEGFEVFKLSNHDRTLANPCLLIQTQDSPSHTLLHSDPALPYNPFDRKILVCTILLHICLIVLIVYLEHKTSEDNFTKEANKPSSMANRLSRRFSLAEILGISECGRVDKGFMDYGREIVAIKPFVIDSKHGGHEFRTEIKKLWGLLRVDLVSLIECCREQREMILDNEHIPSGTLANHPHKLARKITYFHPQSWNQRLQFCFEVSQALVCLHTGLKIIHRDVKASNILLDDNFLTKLSDFGLAGTGIFSESQSQDSTNLKGTPGYIDPNLFTTGKLTKEIDTYSFGVLVLEVLCGRAAMETQNEEDKCSLTTWAVSARVEDVDYDISQEKNMNLIVPNAKINVDNDVSGMLEAWEASRCSRIDFQHGAGCFGKVYKGFLNEKSSGKAGSVTPKKLNPESAQGLNEWQVKSGGIMESTDSTTWPPGFRFRPSELELMSYYLKKKMVSAPFHIDLYNFDPWDLPKRAVFGEQEWFFFSLRDMKRVRTNRVATSGYWKDTRMLKGITKWMVHEYMVKDANSFCGQYNLVRPATSGYWKATGMPKGITKWMVHEYMGEDANRSRGQYNMVDSMKPHLSDRRKIDVGYPPTTSPLELASKVISETDPHWK